MTGREYRMTRATPLMDDSLEAIRTRAAESVTWPSADLAVALDVVAPDVPTDVSDALWRAVQDRAILVELVDSMLREGVLPDLDLPPAAVATTRLDVPPTWLERLIDWLTP